MGERTLAGASLTHHLIRDPDWTLRVHLQLADIAASLESSLERFRRLAASTPESAWSARVDPMSWSVAECVAHLNLTSRAYVPLLLKALDDARGAGTSAPPHYRRSFFGFVISATTGPLPKFGNLRLGKAKTMPSFVPTGDLAKATIISEFEALQRDQLTIVRDANGLPLHRVRVQSAFVPTMSYDAYSALLILPRHQHRHLDQAERVNAARTASVR